MKINHISLWLINVKYNDSANVQTSPLTETIVTSWLKYIPLKIIAIINETGIA